MKEKLEALIKEAEAEINKSNNEQTWDDARVRFLGKKGSLAEAAGLLKTLPPAEKPAMGQALNAARKAIQQVLDEKKAALLAAADLAALASIDPTLPSRELPKGGLHPLTQLQDKAIMLFQRMGFALAEGPEIETEFHCFDALNTPADHPARNEKDTFYLPEGHLLRTHTSSVQIRTMESTPPPLRIIAPGSAYRRDEIDSTHLSVFTQLEGLYVAPDVAISDLKGTLENFFQGLFGEDIELRYRPHFFPFTEPSFEIDIKLHAEGRDPKWIEIAGCGMVDPAVFESVCKSRGDEIYSPEKVRGFAFGMGIERLAMVLWGIRDIRLLIENDTRFLSQFA